ncbi:flavodoxin family protein [Liquorilactobacillus uvarum]|uniref:NADPH-dependent FMN reductase-like domain-containing protein n=1 Tax=Liquorilactobacillus uvarum DSM 19971 TaxID=1423812 RepID=A0A0R1PVD4_9LACO|nr:flavodoxin family protein [Liquorilactobacillus uvarum]KRL36447.1 hypothetical protein FD20_GL001253 [Liquorilactobacillus uvarum DSM 19971]
MKRKIFFSAFFIIILAIAGLVIWRTYQLRQISMRESSESASNNTSSVQKTSKDSTISNSGTQLFINASQNKDGNTATLGKELLGDIQYEQLNLADYHIHQIGQSSVDKDQFDTVFRKMQDAKNIIIGTPVYWSDMSGYLKTLLDRMGEHEDGSLRGKNVYLLIQGSDPSDAIRPITHVVEHISNTFQMNFIGEATTDEQVSNLHDKLFQNSR